MKEFNPSRNLCMMAAILLPMTAEQQEWLRLGGDDVGKVFVDATGIDLTDPDHPGASTRDAKKFYSVESTVLNLTLSDFCSTEKTVSTTTAARASPYKDFSKSLIDRTRCCIVRLESTNLTTCHDEIKVHVRLV